MALETQASGTFQTATGQPISKDTNASTTVEDSNTATSTIPEGKPNDSTAAVDAVVEDTAKPTPVDTEISPQALRQITALSSAKRKLEQELKALQAKIPADDIQAKLDRLAALENETPRDYIKRRNLDLEKVAADVLAGEESTVADPRVDGLSSIVNELKAQLEAEKVAQTANKEALAKEADAKATLQATQLMQDVINSQPTRWVELQNDKLVASEAVKAAIIVVERDYKKPDGSYKPMTPEQRDQIFHDCLDEAETIALARKMVSDRKNGGTSAQPVIPLRKELEVQDSDSYRERHGDDGKNAGTRTPRLTIGDTRSPTRGQGQVKRGPTDVRTARARAMRIAGADVPDE